MRFEHLLGLFGTLFSLISGFWAYATYTREARVAEATAIVQMSETLVGMRMNCRKNWRSLNDLTWVKTLRSQREHELAELIHKNTRLQDKLKSIPRQGNNVEESNALQKEVKALTKKEGRLRREMNEQVRKERCYESFRRSREMVLSASTLIHKPWSTKEKEWQDAWQDFKSVLDKVGTGRYDQDSIGNKWSRILGLKGIFIVDPNYTASKAGSSTGNIGKQKRK